MSRRSSTILSSRLVKLSFPFLGGLAAMAFMVGTLGDIRYRLSKVKEMSANSYYDASTKSSDAKQMLDKMLGNRDINNWENIRGPRPWENSKAMQEAQRQSKE